MWQRQRAMAVPGWNGGGVGVSDVAVAAGGGAAWRGDGGGGGKRWRCRVVVKVLAEAVPLMTETLMEKTQAGKEQTRTAQKSRFVVAAATALLTRDSETLTGTMQAGKRKSINCREKTDTHCMSLVRCGIKQIGNLFSAFQYQDRHSLIR